MLTFGRELYSCDTKNLATGRHSFEFYSRRFYLSPPTVATLGWLESPHKGSQSAVIIHIIPPAENDDRSSFSTPYEVGLTLADYKNYSLEIRLEVAGFQPATCRSPAVYNSRRA